MDGRRGRGQPTVCNEPFGYERNGVKETRGQQAEVPPPFPRIALGGLTQWKVKDSGERVKTVLYWTAI